MNPRTILAALAALVLILAGQSSVAGAAPPALDTPAKQYVVTGAKNADQRSQVARTGAAIDIVRKDGALEVSAIPSELAAINKLGFKTAPAPAPARHPRSATSYHTYAETAAEVDRVAAAYPQIAKKFVAGKSYQNRDIFGLKISDNVGTDENEPEVLYIANIHARERITNEQALYFINELTRGYATDQRVKNLVDNRELWIIPITNPDGQVYDMTSDTQPGRMWRKNRQPNSTSIGTDLNRNFGYRWGCCGGSSGSGSSETYRGTAAESAPETKVIANFVRGRVVGGKQQLKIFLDIHSVANLVLWPFGYTKADTVPGAMSADEEATHRTIGRQLAQSNGYTPEQASDLYITDGTTDDWTFGNQRIFSYTYELGGGSFYPSPANIESLTRVNRESLLKLAEYADCPYRAIGKEQQYCSTS
ncbi:M14 family metallopeptidase [Spirillospora sp. CA-294931]|uniref:M14 family metallopeptidase n=1 Tax=Spirillospora sp. CA-294931 TaxID=3240042 RepID=UPI003D8C5686